jgi:hypothetical protein
LVKQETVPELFIFDDIAVGEQCDSGNERIKAIYPDVISRQVRVTGVIDKPREVSAVPAVDAVLPVLALVKVRGL